MPTLPVTTSTGGHFVLQPGRATFDAGNEMFGRCGDEAYFEFSAAPNTVSAVALENYLHPLSPVHNCPINRLAEPKWLGSGHADCSAPTREAAG